MAKKSDPCDQAERNGATTDDDVLQAIESVTRKWTKQRKAEEKDETRVRQRALRLTFCPSRITTKEAAYRIMAEAYDKASAGGTLPVKARQVMYVARPQILELTGKTELNDAYFTQVLLPDYIRENELEDAWDVHFDARGNLVEPHTGRAVPLGTAEVRAYLLGQNRHPDGPADGIARLSRAYPTQGPTARFGAILFIEKEGFQPLFKAVRLAEKYDLAVMYSKGMSTTAARTLAEELCAQGQNVPLLTLHDLDQAGFSITATLQRNTRRFAFESDLEIHDLGLRLADVRGWHLESEIVRIRGDPDAVAWQLRQDGATDKEVEFLLSGRRVELNAFTSADLVRWIEAKLQEHGVKKVIPEDAILAEGYRWSLQRKILNDQLDDLAEHVAEQAAQTPVPKGLRRRVGKILRDHPEMPWDDAVSQIVDNES
jgi:hypothetical protein